jgi:hypothetical protein
MTRDREAGGATLATAIVVLLVASLVTAAVGEVARTELVVARSRRTLARGLAAADACLARVVATLPAGWSHSGALAGADGTIGTTDDGLLVAPAGCSATLLPGPLGAARPLLDVTATVPGGGRRLRAVIGRAAALPAVVWATSGMLGRVAGHVTIDGVDHGRPDLAPLAAVASPDDPAVVDAWLRAVPAVVPVGPTAPASYAPPPPLAEVATRLVAGGATAAFTPAPTPPPPTLHAIAGDLAITTAGFGAGVLEVDGRLDIQADFAFSGVVAASGGVGVANGATLRIGGALWVGAPAFDCDGTIALEHDRAALDAAHALFPLPRRASVAGMVDR